MNHKRREALRQASQLLGRVGMIIQRALDDEQDCRDNMPENMAGGDRCDAMEHAIACLEEAVDAIETAQEQLAEAIT